MSTLSDFHLEPSDLAFLGRDLSRPECVLARPDGTLWISDNRGGVTRLAPDGTQTRLGKLDGDPNGIALERDGSLLIANISAARLDRLHPDGRSECVLDTFEGRPLGAANFVLVDGDRVWVTVSTRAVPRSEAIRAPRPDGYVLLIGKDQPPRLAGEGFHFTNELRFDRARRHVYVAETARGCITRLRVEADGSFAGPPEPFGPDPLFPGAHVDGIAFDADGNLWVTEINRNALVVITPDGRAHTVFEDPAGETLSFPTSIAFGGDDLRTAYVGSLRMNRIARFRAPVPGEPLDHWR
jgi:sugar lactone lactonase YvrE